MKSHLVPLPSVTPQTEVTTAAPVTQVLANCTVFRFQTGYVYSPRSPSLLQAAPCLWALPNAGEEARKAPGCLGFLAALTAARHLMLMDFKSLLGTKSPYYSFENPAVHTLPGLASRRSTKQENHWISANGSKHTGVAPRPLAGLHL